MTNYSPPSTCSECGGPIYKWEMDSDGGMVALFECGGSRYWARAELLAGSSPVLPTVDCRRRPLPDFFLEHRWRTVRPTTTNPKQL